MAARGSKGPNKGIPKVFSKGPAPGRPAKRPAVVFREIISAQPNDVERKAIAEALGFASYEDVPGDFESGPHALWWIVRQLAIRGDRESLREILDRMNPKPRRMEVSGPNGGPMRSQITTTAPTEEQIASGEAYYATLTAAEEEEDS